MADLTPLAIGAVVGAIVGWFLKQWQSVNQTRKIVDERDSLRRQLQESLDERETDWNEINAECSKDIGVLTDATWSHDTAALEKARDRVCRSITARIIPRYIQLVRRRVLYHKNDWDHCLAIVEDATRELRKWEYHLGIVNDPWLLDETRQEECTLNQYELTELITTVRLEVEQWQLVRKRGIWKTVGRTG